MPKRVDVTHTGGGATDRDKTHFNVEQRRILEEKLRAYREKQEKWRGKGNGGPDAAATLAEREIERTQRELKRIYEQAAREMYQKQQDFIRRHKYLDQQYRAMVARGELSEADYQAWLNGGQVFQSDEWKKRQRIIAEQMTHSDEIAVDMLADRRAELFAEGANYTSYQLERRGGGDYGLDVQDRKTVGRLLIEKPDLLPRPKIDAGKDYNWYNKVVTDAVTQGILQHETLDQIIKRACQDTGDKALTTMTRNARTAYRGAVSAGREEAMRESEDKGLAVRKRWVCSMLPNSRDAHVKLDGQTAAVGEPFISMLGPIMHPGDPSAAPGNVYNCECYIIEEPVKYPIENLTRYNPKTGEPLKNMSYDEWKAWKNSAEGRELKEWLADKKERYKGTLDGKR